MQEQLIEFKTAKLAKEKGFDWEVNHYYDTTNCNWHRVSKYENLTNKCWIQEPDGSNCKSRIGWISAPTQSHLQKWLRDVHKIYLQPILLSQLVPESGWGYELTWIDKKIKTVFNTDESEEYKTCEESLEVGLLEALKLI